MASDLDNRCPETDTDTVPASNGKAVGHDWDADIEARIRNSWPLPLRLLLEQRAVWEFALFGLTRAVLTNVPRGDGHPVLVLPGYRTTDRSTWPLRNYLAELGYDAQGWQLGRNLGPTGYVVADLESQLSALSEDRSRTVSLIGWSLGGVYARELARTNPAAVRTVITLGAPFRPIEEVRGWSAPPVPSTSIYSRMDAVVSWPACVDDASGERENIEVWGAHFGLGHNPLVAAIIADRLACPEGEWTPYERERFRPFLELKSCLG